MFKAFGKKLKKEQQDEGQANLVKSSGHMNKNVAAKEKEKARVRKDSKRKKQSARDSIIDGSREDSGDRSPTNSPAHLENSTYASSSKKAAKRVSTECEETVNNAVAELFDSAWKVCAERFFISSAPLAVSVELRNTWLRIVEAEWQDPSIREKVSSGNNRIFQSDEPPLPSAFDSWARGAMAPLPHIKRESIMDPFLRDLVPGQDGLISVPQFADDTPSKSSSQISENQDGLPQITPQEKSEKKVTLKDDAKPATQSVVVIVEPKQSVEDGDEWNFALDRKIYLNLQKDEIIPDGTLDSKTVFANDGKLHSKSVESEIVEANPFQVVLDARHHVIGNDSTTDHDEPLPKTKNTKSPIKVSKRFSPSQCGGNTGSGIFRSINETTAEALLARNGKTIDDEKVKGPQILEKNAQNAEDIVRLKNRGHKSFYINIEHVDDEPVVQPLFEEPTLLRRTESVPLSRSASVWGPSRSVAQLKGREAFLQQMALDEEYGSSRFLWRTMINLRSRFKRQAIRSLTARADAAEAAEAALAERSSYSTFTASDVSKASLVTAVTSNTRTQTKTKNHKNHKDHKQAKKSKSRTTSVISNPRSRSAVNLQSKSASSAVNVSKSASSHSITEFLSDTQLPTEYLNKERKSFMTTHASMSEVSVSVNMSKPTVVVSKKMANVRATRRANQNTGSRFQDAAQVEAQIRFENKKVRPPAAPDSVAGSSVASTIDGIVQDENRQERMSMA